MWLYIILYIILFIVIIFMLVMGYIKIRHRFWSKQPVFHYYNLWYWLRPPGIIQHAFPEANEYVNIINVKIIIRIKINAFYIRKFQKFHT